VELLNPAQSTTATSGLPKIDDQVGTGSIVSAGYIVTNKHVVKNADHLEMTRQWQGDVGPRTFGKFDVMVRRDYWMLSS
jgi:S1-C subfamily serine protease